MYFFSETVAQQPSSGVHGAPTEGVHCNYNVTLAGPGYGVGDSEEDGWSPLRQGGDRAREQLKLQECPGSGEGQHAASLVPTRDGLIALTPSLMPQPTRHSCACVRRERPRMSSLVRRGAAAAAAVFGSGRVQQVFGQNNDQNIWKRGDNLG